MSKPKEISYGFKIPEASLWALDVPTEAVSIDEISYNLDIPYLEHEGTDDWNMSITSLLANFNNEPHHAAQVERANLDYPIELYLFDGRWIILDGVHRLTKAIRLGRTQIKARRIPQLEIDRLLSTL